MVTANLPRMVRPSSLDWQVSGASVRGASHVRTRMPCQDAIGWRLPAVSGEPVVLAIADGHGSSHYVRSHKGAKLAVRIAIGLLWDLAQTHMENSGFSTLKSLMTEQIPRTLVRAWREAVKEHHNSMPFDDGELQKLSAVRANRVLSDPVIAYGTTLIAAVLTSEYMSFLQIGDGDILIVDDRGGVSRPPLPHDARLLANQTTSLCGKEAWRDARSYLQPLATRPPALIMISTDGYANSFADDDGFYCAATDLLEAAQTTGIRKVGRQLPQWLRITSEAGSGDDITVCLAYRQVARQTG